MSEEQTGNVEEQDLTKDEVETKEDELIVVPTLDEILKATKSNDAKLKTILNELTTDIPIYMITDEAFDIIKKVYAKALNREKCPCGSNQDFSECCKASWQLLQRSWKNRDKEDRQNKKQEHKQEQAANMTKWYLQVGVNGNGSVAIKNHGSIQENLPLPMTINLLQDALDSVKLQRMTMMVQHMMEERLSQPRMNKNSGPKIAGL